MSSDHKSKFDLEPNPFERSFATKESSSLSLNELANTSTTSNNNNSNSNNNNSNNKNNDTNSDLNSIGSNSAITSSTKNTNKHNLHIPNISTVNQQSQDGISAKLPGITPPLFTPGGRRLPPIGLSPGGSGGGSSSTIRQYNSGLSNGSMTNNPDSNLWPGFIGSQNSQAPQLQLQQNFSQLLSGIRKTGLTPNESNLRLGLTPGGLGGFGFSNHLVPGLSTPSALLNGPITPGLSSLLGIPANSSLGVTMGNGTSLPMQQQSQQQPHQQTQMVGQIPQPVQLQQNHGQDIALIQNSSVNNQAAPVVVAVPPQIAQQLPQQQGVIHTIPENPGVPFPIPTEAESVPVPVPVPVPVAVPQPAPQPAPRSVQSTAPPSSAPAVTLKQENGSTPSPPTSAASTTTSRKRKNSLKQTPEPAAQKKKAKTTRAKKKDAKEKTKSDPVIEPISELQQQQQQQQHQEEFDDDDTNDVDSDEQIKGNGEIKDDQEESKATKGKGKKRANNDEEKRKNFLERNRVAASKCRQRKKQLIQKMEDELAFYLTGYRELSAQVAQLRGQLMTLKNVLSGHKDCGMFIQYVGGFNALNELLHQADFATQVTEGAHTNMTSMPSTIPTTLNNVAPTNPTVTNTARGSSTTGTAGTTTSVIEDDGSNDDPPSAPTVTMAPPLPINVNTDHNSTHSNTRDVTPDISFAQLQQLSNRRSLSAIQSGVNPSVNIVSHHSLTDLPAAAAAAGGNSAGGSIAVNGGAGIFGNSGNNRIVSGDGSNTTGGGRDLRAISSMSNLAGMNTNNGTSTVSPF